MRKFLEKFLEKELHGLGYRTCSLIGNGDCVIVGLEGENLEDTDFFVLSLSVLGKMEQNKREEHLRNLFKKTKKDMQ